MDPAEDVVMDVDAHYCLGAPTLFVMGLVTMLVLNLDAPGCDSIIEAGFYLDYVCSWAQ